MSRSHVIQLFFTVLEL